MKMRNAWLSGMSLKVEDRK